MLLSLADEPVKESGEAENNKCLHTNDLSPVEEKAKSQPSPCRKVLSPINSNTITDLVNQDPKTPKVKSCNEENRFQELGTPLDKFKVYIYICPRFLIL